MNFPATNFFLLDATNKATIEIFNFYFYTVYLMVLILDSNSEIGARSNLCYTICLRNLIRSRTVTNQIFLLHARAAWSELLSNINMMVFYMILISLLNMPHVGTIQ